MAGFCLNWEDSKPGKKLPFSVLFQFNFSPLKTVLSVFCTDMLFLCVLR